MPDRLQQPLIRSGARLRPVTWPEALKAAADGVADSVGRHGPESFGAFSCSKATNELNYALQRFARTVVGSNNIDSCNRT